MQVHTAGFMCSVQPPMKPYVNDKGDSKFLTHNNQDLDPLSPVGMDLLVNLLPKFFFFLLISLFYKTEIFFHI